MEVAYWATEIELIQNDKQREVNQKMNKEANIYTSYNLSSGIYISLRSVQK